MLFGGSQSQLNASACKLLALFLLQLLFHTCRPSAVGPSAEADTGNVEVGEERTVFLRPDGAPRTCMAARQLSRRHGARLLG